MTGNPEFRLQWEWEPAPTIRAPELRATFARLWVFVGDECVTLVEDRESASSRRSIACSLYPLAEWVAYNWWFLRADTRSGGNLPALRSGRQSLVDRRIRQRHCLRGAGDGFLWPNLFLLPEDSSTHLLWLSDKTHAENRPIRFLAHGEATVDSSDIQLALARFVDAVIERLSDLGIGSSRLHEEWSAIQETEPEEAEYCLAAARLGLDPYAEAARYEGNIIQAAEQLDPELLGDFLSAVTPERIPEDLRWVAAARKEIESFSGVGTAALEALSESLPSGGGGHTPTLWHRGYADAKMVRRRLSMAPTDPFSFDGYLTEAFLPASDRGLQAMGGSRNSIVSQVVLGHRQRESSARFTLARALWNILFRPREQFLITRGSTARQKIERAFAAELLAPAEGVAQLIGSDPSEIGIDELESTESHFRVSSLIVQHQIENQLEHV